MTLKTAQTHVEVTIERAAGWDRKTVSRQVTSRWNGVLALRFYFVNLTSERWETRPWFWRHSPEEVGPRPFRWGWGGREGFAGSGYV